MDETLLTFFNQTLAHPLLDGLMLSLSLAAMGFYPLLGLVLTATPTYRRVGLAVVMALVASLIWTLGFQFTISRLRPQEVRLIWPMSHFPSYPSGHAAASFAIALVIALHLRQPIGWGITLIGASLVALSRIYLGLHYPSDVLAGSVLGASVGMACYGLLLAPDSETPRWKWFLWPQLALAFLATHLAYLGLLPLALLRWPGADKLLHFLLFGAIAFWLNAWLQKWTVTIRGWRISLTLMGLSLYLMVDEALQGLSPLRTVDWGDLMCGIIGVWFFWWLSERLSA